MFIAFNLLGEYYIVMSWIAIAVWALLDRRRASVNNCGARLLARLEETRHRAPDDIDFAALADANSIWQGRVLICRVLAATLSVHHWS